MKEQIKAALLEVVFEANEEQIEAAVLRAYPDRDALIAEGQAAGEISGHDRSEAAFAENGRKQIEKLQGEIETLKVEAKAAARTAKIAAAAEHDRGALSGYAQAMKEIGTRAGLAAKEAEGAQGEVTA